jgi:hypothetical protein
MLRRCASPGCARLVFGHGMCAEHDAASAQLSTGEAPAPALQGEDLAEELLVEAAETNRVAERETS